MIRIIPRLFTKIPHLNIIKPHQFMIKPYFTFSKLTQMMQKKQSEKTQQEIKKQIEHLANKPTFTLMDYKQRILDQLNKLKSSIRAKISSQTQEQQKQLQIERKVLNCLYEEELNQQYELKYGQRIAISRVSQVDYKKVTEIFKKASRYQKMHAMLRGMKQRGEALPRDMQQLNYMYVRSGLEFQGPKQKYLKYEKRSRIQRNRFIKWRVSE